VADRSRDLLTSSRMSVAATTADASKPCRLQPTGREMPSSGDIDCAVRLTGNGSSGRHHNFRTAESHSDRLSPSDVIAKHRSGGVKQHRKSSTKTSSVDVRKLAQPEVVIGEGGGGGTAMSDDDDDRASVCSSQSSASEHSTTSRSSTGSKTTHRRTRCPLHHASRSSSRRQQQQDGSSTGGGVDVSTAVASKPGEASGTCTCRASTTSGRRKHTTKTAAVATSVDDPAGLCNVERPEPEGGLPTGPMFKSTIDEFERLIYGPSEPLFSDCDDTVDEELSKPSTAESSVDSRLNRPPRMIGSWIAGGVRGITSSAGESSVVDPTESLFSAAQMINSNNLMKFAIIQTELKNVKDVSLRRVRITSTWKFRNVKYKNSILSDVKMLDALIVQ